MRRDELQRRRERVARVNAPVVTSMRIVGGKLRERVLVWRDGELNMEMRVRDQARLIRAALVRLLWNSVVDDSTCVCDSSGPGPECLAWQALYGQRHWPGARKAEKKLAKEPLT